MDRKDTRRCTLRSLQAGVKVASLSQEYIHCGKQEYRFNVKRWGNTSFLPTNTTVVWKANDPTTERCAPYGREEGLSVGLVAEGRGTALSECLTSSKLSYPEGETRHFVLIFQRKEKPNARYRNERDQQRDDIRLNNSFSRCSKDSLKSVTCKLAASVRSCNNRSL